MEVRSFDSDEEMWAYMEAAHQAAMDAITPHQRRLMDGRGFFWFRHYPEVQQGFSIWGERWSLEKFVEVYEARAVKAEAEGDPDTAEEWRTSYREEPEKISRGYFFGMAYSEIEPEGELGSTHASVMIEVSRETYEKAREHNWSLTEMIADPTSFEDGVITVRRWNDNLMSQVKQLEALKREREEGT